VCTLALQEVSMRRAGIKVKEGEEEEKKVALK
jgi:hypothetical protein